MGWLPGNTDFKRSVPGQTRRRLRKTIRGGPTILPGARLIRAGTRPNRQTETGRDSGSATDDIRLRGRSVPQTGEHAAGISMTPPKKGKKGRRQRRPPPPRKLSPSRHDHTANEEGRVDGLEQLFDSLRSGAANVAGVTFQIATTAWILAAGRDNAIPGLDVQSVAPEGFEDIDCELRSGLTLLVQTKERGVGARAIAAAEVAKIIVHAVPALRADARFAIVTNGRFGSSLPTTGFTATLDEGLSAIQDDGRKRATLVDALRGELDGMGLSGTPPESLLPRVHLVVIDVDIAEQTLASLENGIDVPPSVASLVRAELLRDLAELAAQQREASLATAGRRTLTDLDLVTTRTMQNVDVPSLEEAIAAGICEPADFMTPPSVELAGFFAGVDVLPSHVAAGFDVVRPEETAAILQGLEDSQDVVVAGPSGSGKSALLWRSARVLEFGVRVLRIHRVADADDVELLVRHVRRQRPTMDMRLLVVADDLGRDRMAAWPDARRRIREIPGVLVLGGVRREDLTPQISGSAVVVDPTLTQSAATSIYDALVAANVPTLMAREEAVGRAEGLLMEFIALATTGHRLRDVLSVQVDDLGTPERHVSRDALRLVCAAHLLGFPVPADALPEALGIDADTAGRAMSRLAGEYLVVAEGHLWHGLHDLRTEVLFDLLHAAPPPTKAATYARALSVLPDAAQGPAARRAAVRIGRVIAEATPELDPDERLGSILEALGPVANVLRDQLTHVATSGGGDDAAAHAASLIEAGDRLDSTAYVHAVLPFVEQNRPPTANLAALAGLLYGIRVDHVNFESVEGAKLMVGLDSQLPDRRSTCASTVASGLTPDLLVGLAKDATVSTAIRLLEATEGLIILTANHAREAYEFHVSPLPNPPGSTGTRADCDLRAQLTASLAVLGQVRGPDVASTFGPVEARAADAVACDDHGCSVELTLQPSEPPADAARNLARSYTYSKEEMMVARAVLFARTAGADPIPSAYPPRPGADPGSLNEQAVLLARRLSDACPEIDQVNVEVWQANCRPTSPTRDDVKSLRTGVMRRRPAVARNVAFQAGVAEALSAENWTRRLLEQATLAQALMRQVEELLDRFRSYDNAGRRRDWVRRVHQTAQGVANMPGRPAERRPVLGAARSAALRQSAAEIDEELRAKDEGKAAFEGLTGALQQVAANLDDPRMVRLAGSRFAEVPALMREARAAGMPTFSGVGETLPLELDDRAGFIGRLLTALDNEVIARAVRDSARNRNLLEELMTETAASAAKQDGDIVAAFLREHQVNADTAVIPNETPIPAWRNRRAVVTIDLELWARAVEVLQEWDAEARDELGLSGRVVVVAVESGEVLPVGLGFFGAIGDVIPLLPEDLAVIAEELGSLIRRSDVRRAIQLRSAELEAYSYEVTRRVNRDPSWSAVPGLTATPQETAAIIREEFREPLKHAAQKGSPDDAEGYAGTAATLLLQLCEEVAGETGRDEGLAAQLASVDITDLSALALGTSGQLYAAAQVAAIESDRASRH
jgi:hypothetical protein